MNADEQKAVEANAWQIAERAGYVPGARVRVIGPASYADCDTCPECCSHVGRTGKILYMRGPWQAWVLFSDGLGTTFDLDHLEVLR